MKNLSITLLLGISSMLTGCLPANTTTYESARMLAPKAFEVQGNASMYYGTLDDPQAAGWGFRTANIGGAIAYGISPKLAIRARYERIQLVDRAELPGEPLLASGSHVNYSEFSLKYGWKQKKRKAIAAVSLPVGLISFTGGQIFYVTPTAHATIVKSDQFEFGINGKLHFWLNDGPVIPWTSIGLGFGFSKDLNRWAVRPEIGFDFYNVSLGLGYSYIFPPKTNHETR